MASNPSKEFLTLAQLRERRLKPAPGQAPASRYWQGMGWVATYAVELAVSMRPRRTPTERQRLALEQGRALAGTIACALGCGARLEKTRTRQQRICGSCLYQAELADIRRIASQWLADTPLFLDTETTGLTDHDEVIEVGVVDAAGHVVFETLIRPAGACSDEARAVHGISEQELRYAPSWAAVGPLLARLLAGRHVISHNAEFDLGMLRQTERAHGRQVGLAVASWSCTLELLTELNGSRWPRMSQALALAGAEPLELGPHHRASADAERCRRVVTTLARG